MLDELEHNRKLVPYVDMPIQHIDDEILKRMKRGTPRKLIEERIATLRARIPGIALRTTLIVGFPGETDAAFESLLAFLAQAQFERLGCFTYSPEQGSAAALLDDDVPRAVKEARRARVMDLQRRLIDERNARLEGSVVRVIVDRLGDQGPIGRTQADAPDIDCAILLAGDAAPGEIRDARVVGRSGYDLRGTLL
ncbi:MAG: radical SAM protein [Planctomycetota bacterium]